MRRSPYEIVQHYKSCVVRITVENQNRDLVNGTGFHIGGGHLVTARHVVEAGRIDSIVGESRRTVEVRATRFARDAGVDLAVLETDFSPGRGTATTSEGVVPTRIVKGHEEREEADYIEIGGHLDDWIGDEFLLSKCVLMGFPPIPRSSDPVLVAMEAEVNAVIDKYGQPHPHFIISAIPRGGFSGGPVFSEWGFLLGVMTESVYGGERPPELGFAAAISIEPLLVMLHEERIACGENLVFADRLFRGELGR